MAAKKPKPKARTSDASSEFALYDGTRLLGSFAPRRGGGFTVYDAKGRRLGNAETRDAARLAIANGKIEK